MEDTHHLPLAPFFYASHTCSQPKQTLTQEEIPTLTLKKNLLESTLTSIVLGGSLPFAFHQDSSPQKLKEGSCVLIYDEETTAFIPNLLQNITPLRMNKKAHHPNLNLFAQILTLNTTQILAPFFQMQKVTPHAPSSKLENTFCFTWVFKLEKQEFPNQSNQIEASFRHLGRNRPSSDRLQL